MRYGLNFLNYDLTLWLPSCYNGNDIRSDSYYGRYNRSKIPLNQRYYNQKRHSNSASISNNNSRRRHKCHRQNSTLFLLRAMAFCQRNGDGLPRFKSSSSHNSLSIVSIASGK